MPTSPELINLDRVLSRTGECYHGAMPKRDFRISLPEELGAVAAFFNCISDYAFVSTIRGLVDGVSHGINAAHCDFPADFEPDEEPFEGVRFSLFEDEVVIDQARFVEIVEMACRVQMRDFPETTEEMQ